MRQVGGRKRMKLRDGSVWRERVEGSGRWGNAGGWGVVDRSNFFKSV